MKLFFHGRTDALYRLLQGLSLTAGLTCSLAYANPEVGGATTSTAVATVAATATPSSAMAVIQTAAPASALAAGSGVTPVTAVSAASASAPVAIPPMPPMPTTSTASSATSNLLQVSLSLTLVLALLFFASWAFKRFGAGTLHANLPVRVIGAISIGNNQRIMVLEAGESWIVLGVTPQQISTITTLPRQESSIESRPNFSAWLQQSLEKYHVKKP